MRITVTIDDPGEDYFLELSEEHGEWTDEEAAENLTRLAKRAGEQLNDGVPSSEPFDNGGLPFEPRLKPFSYDDFKPAGYVGGECPECEPEDEHLAALGRIESLLSELVENSKPRSTFIGTVTADSITGTNLSGTVEGIAHNDLSRQEGEHAKQVLSGGSNPNVKHPGDYIY